MAPAPAAPLVLRRAGPRDLDTLTLHRRRMWRDIGRSTTAELDASDPPYRRWIAGKLRQRRAVGWIVESEDGRVAGSGVVWLPETQPRPGRRGGAHPYLMSMYTAPAFRGRGVASRIVEASLEWARAAGYRRMTLHASEMGRPVYERLGFSIGREMVKELRTPARRPSTTGRRKPLSRISR